MLKLKDLVMCTLETDSIGDKSEDHSFVSQIEEEGSGHGMEEGDDDDNMSEMLDILSVGINSCTL